METYDRHHPAVLPLERRTLSEATLRRPKGLLDVRLQIAMGCFSSFLFCQLGNLRPSDDVDAFYIVTVCHLLVPGIPERLPMKLGIEHGGVLCHLHSGPLLQRFVQARENLQIVFVAVRPYRLLPQIRSITGPANMLDD